MRALAIRKAFRISGLAYPKMAQPGQEDGFCKKIGVQGKGSVDPN
jgi:hypothetical protein